MRIPSLIRGVVIITVAIALSDRSVLACGGLICLYNVGCDYYEAECTQGVLHGIPVKGFAIQGFATNNGTKCGTKPCGSLRCACGPRFTDGEPCDQGPAPPPGDAQGNVPQGAQP